MKKEIIAQGVGAAPGVFSQAVEANGFVFVSGQVPTTEGWEMVGETVEEKLAQIMKNISTILHAADLTLDDIVKATVYVTDLAQMPEINMHYPTYFNGILPAREAVCVTALPLGATVEISVIAAK